VDGDILKNPSVVLSMISGVKFCTEIFNNESGIKNDIGPIVPVKLNSLKNHPKNIRKYQMPKLYALRF
jgi:hypothetical protein